MREAERKVGRGRGGLLMEGQGVGMGVEAWRRSPHFLLWVHTISLFGFLSPPSRVILSSSSGRGEGGVIYLGCMHTTTAEPRRQYDTQRHYPSSGCASCASPLSPLVTSQTEGGSKGVCCSERGVSGCCSEGRWWGACFSEIRGGAYRGQLPVCYSSVLAVTAGRAKQEVMFRPSRCVKGSGLPAQGRRRTARRPRAAGGLPGLVGPVRRPCAGPLAPGLRLLADPASWAWLRVARPSLSTWTQGPIACLHTAALDAAVEARRRQAG
jgi:hypothetical protein